MNQEEPPEGEQIKIPRWIFKNSIKLNFKSIKGYITHKEVITSLCSTLDDIQLNNIIYLGHFTTNKIWIIQFSEKIQASSLIGREIKFKNQHIQLEDPNSVAAPKVKYATLRFDLLPPGFRDASFIQFLSELKIKDLKIIEITDEYYSYDGWTNVKNGVKRIKISYSRDAEKYVNNLAGFAMFYGYKTSISFAGQKTRCKFCGDPQHSLDDCPVKDEICNRCNQHGHSSDKCDMATRLKSIQRSRVDYFDLIGMEEGLENPNTSNSTKNNQEIQNKQSTNTQPINNTSPLLPPLVFNQVISTMESEISQAVGADSSENLKTVRRNSQPNTNLLNVKTTTRPVTLKLNSKTNAQTKPKKTNNNQTNLTDQTHPTTTQTTNIMPAKKQRLQTAGNSPEKNNENRTTTKNDNEDIEID